MAMVSVVFLVVSHHSKKTLLVACPLWHMAHQSLMLATAKFAAKFKPCQTAVSNESCQEEKLVEATLPLDGWKPHESVRLT